MTALENMLYQMAESVARARGSQPAIIVSENSITVEFEHPIESDTRAWDKSQYSFGNIFYQGYSNALKLKEEDIDMGNIKLMPSSKYKNFMKTKVIEDAFYADSMKNQKMLYLLFGSLALNVIVLLAVVATA